MDDKAKFYEVSEDTITKFMEVYETKTFGNGIGFDFIGSSKQKTMILVTLVPPRFSFKLNKEVSVSINEDIMDAMGDDETVTILIEQELDKLSLDLKTGEVKMNKHRLVTSPGLVNKYGIDKVGRANSIDELAVKQYSDELL